MSGNPVSLRFLSSFLPDSGATVGPGRHPRSESRDSGGTRMILQKLTAPSPRGFALALVFVAGFAGSAAAQRSDRIEQIERQLADLQRYMYSGGGGGAPGGGDNSYRERVEVRLNALESELRDMTGRVEETNHAVRKIQERLDKLVQDLDYRLTSLERAMQSGGPPPAGGTAASTTSPPPSSEPPQGLAVTTRPPRGSAPGTTEPPRTSAASLPGGNEMEQYSYAQRLVAQTRYDEAEGALREFLRRNPTSPLADNARYWLGETYYVRKRYEDAAGTFLEAYQASPKGTKAADSLLKLGLSLAALKKNQEACVALTKLTRENPTADGSILRRAEQEKSSLSCG